MSDGAIIPLAKQHEALFQFAIEDFREKFLFAFKIMSDGMPQQWAKHARKIIGFFEDSTTPEVWAQLSQIPDPDNPAQSLGQSWLSEWERLAGAVGGKQDDHNSRASEADRQEPAGY